MIVPFKLVVAAGAIAALPFAVPVDLSEAQSPTAPAAEVVEDVAVARSAVANDDFRQEATWNFAELQYTSTNGEKRTVSARRITKLWLLKGAEGQVFLELLYENRDYSFVAVREFHVIRRSSTVSSVDVPVIRDHFDAMAFPSFR